MKNYIFTRFHKHVRASMSERDRTGKIQPHGGQRWEKSTIPLGFGSGENGENGELGMK